MERRGLLKGIAVGGITTSTAGCLGFFEDSSPGNGTGADGPTETETPSGPPDRPDGVPDGEPIVLETLEATTKQWVENNSFAWKHEITGEPVHDDSTAGFGGEVSTLRVDRESDRGLWTVVGDSQEGESLNEWYYAGDRQSGVQRSDPADGEVTVSETDDGLEDFYNRVWPKVYNRMMQVATGYTWTAAEWDPEREAFIAEVESIGGEDGYSHDPLADGDQHTGEIYINADGIVTNLWVSAVRTFGGDSGEIELVWSASFTDLEKASVEEPEWVGDA